MHWKAECDKVLKRFTQASGGQSEDVWIFAYRFQDQQIGLSRILLLEGLPFSSGIHQNLPLVKVRHFV